MSPKNIIFQQYALQDRARSFGWLPSRIKVLDGDLGRSGSSTTDRTDFKTLVADVSLGNAGAVLALEASRLARSNADWHRDLRHYADADH